MQKLMTLTLVFMAFLASAAFARDLSDAHLYVKRFRQISPAIFAGGNPVTPVTGDKGLDVLVDLGIVSVINLQGGDIDGTITGRFAAYLQKGENPIAIAYEKMYLEERGLTFYNFPLNSHAPKSAQEDLDIREALRLMHEATPEKPLFIHCQHGADRTGLLIALYRVIYENVDPTIAYLEWVKYGHTRVARFITGDLDVYFTAFLNELSKERDFTAPLVSSSDCLGDLIPEN